MFKELQSILKSIDESLETYSYGDVKGNSTVADIFAERASHRPMLKEVINSASDALEKFPLHPQLLQRRSYAMSLYCTPEGEHPYLEEAEVDLKLLLELEPLNIYFAAELLDIRYIYSIIEDDEAAAIADELALKAEFFLIHFRDLQIRALANADRYKEAKKVYDLWSSRFPKNKDLKKALQMAQEITPDDEL